MFQNLTHHTLPPSLPPVVFFQRVVGTGGGATVRGRLQRTTEALRAGKGAPVNHITSCSFLTLHFM